MSSRAKGNPDLLPPEALLTVRQVSALIRGSEKYVRELLRSGDLQSIPWGSAGELRVPRWCVMKWQERFVHEPDLRVKQILYGAGKPRRAASRHQDRPLLSAVKA